MRKKQTLATLLTIAMLSLSCKAPESRSPTILSSKDVTGDGIPDIRLNHEGKQYLFLGRADGNHNRAVRRTDGPVSYFLLDGIAKIDSNGISYIGTNSVTAYFFDGNHYRISPQPRK